MSIIFIGTPEFAVPSLLRLVESGHEIQAVITQPDRPAGRGQQPRISAVKQAALGKGLKVLQPPSLREPRVSEEIAALRPEVMVAVAYGQILRPDFLAIAPRGVVNVHPSLLPKYRGASPIQSAILAGDTVTGVTIMLMDKGMDSGPTLAQEKMLIGDADTGGSLSAKLAVAGADLLERTLRKWLDGTIDPEAQDDMQATTTRLLAKEDGLIDWSKPAIEIWRQVRAFDPWPGTYTTFAGERLSILRSHPLEDGEVGIGRVVEVVDQDAAVAVGTADGLVVLDEVQRQGRKRMSGRDFARGAQGLVGTTLK